MSLSVSSSPGGQPSTTQPIAGPWLSPKVVTVNSRPKVSPAIAQIVLLPYRFRPALSAASLPRKSPASSTKTPWPPRPNSIQTKGSRG